MPATHLLRFLLRDDRSARDAADDAYTSAGAFRTIDAHAAPSPAIILMRRTRVGAYAMRAMLRCFAHAAAGSRHHCCRCSRQSTAQGAKCSSTASLPFSPRRARCNSRQPRRGLSVPTPRRRNEKSNAVTVSMSKSSSSMSYQAPRHVGGGRHAMMRAITARNCFLRKHCERRAGVALILIIFTLLSLTTYI